MFQTSFHVFRPRHPLLRLLAGALGIVATLVLIALGAFAVAALLVGGALFVLINAFRSARSGHLPSHDAPAAPLGIIEGEFKVIEDSQAGESSSTPR